MQSLRDRHASPPSRRAPYGTPRVALGHSVEKKMRRSRSANSDEMRLGRAPTAYFFSVNSSFSSPLVVLACQ